MSLELNELLESDEDDCDYVPSEKELQEAEKELSLIKSTAEAKEETSSVLNPADEKEKAEKIWKDFVNDQNISQKKEPTSELSSEKSELKSTDLSGPSKVEDADNASVDAKPTSSKPVNVENANLKPTMKRKGLSSVFDNLKSKKNKQTILQKSLSDWNEYKKEEGIEEDLRTFNKGKGGYLNRQSFLERTDIRSFEIERDLRLSKK